MNPFFEKPSCVLARMLLFLFLFCCVFAEKPASAQETGPLMMKQELGYTLAGGVAGVGVGAILWFMDPLNPGVQPASQAKNGFIYGTAFGALFGFYLLNNSVKFPSQNVPVQNFDDLLGMENQRASRKETSKGAFGWHLPIIQFRF